MYWVAQGFPSGSAVKNLPVMQETQVQSLKEEEMATYSSILSGTNSLTEGPGGLQSMGS